MDKNFVHFAGDVTQLLKYLSTYYAGSPVLLAASHEPGIGVHSIIPQCKFFGDRARRIRSLRPTVTR